MVVQVRAVKLLALSLIFKADRLWALRECTICNDGTGTYCKTFCIKLETFSPFQTWILENMTDMFQENFVVDIEEENTR